MAKSRILLVEDHALIAEEIQQQLTKLGYEVVGTIDTGEDAISMAEVLSPDLVLLDVHLKGQMDGLEAGRLIRASVGCAITYMTGDFLAKGTNGCLRKPFSPAALARSIGTALAVAEAEKSPQSNSASTSPALTSSYDRVSGKIDVE